MPDLTGQPTPPAAAGTTAAPGTVAPVVSDTTTAPTGIVSEGFVNSDGSFVDGWQGRLADETMRTDDTLARFSNFDDLAKSYVNIRKQVPMDKVTIPTETSPPELWEEFHKAIGRPDTLEEYVAEKPADMPDEYWDKELLTAAKTLSHKIGISQAQWKALFEFDNQRAADGQRKLAEAEERETAEAEKVINELWGIDKDAKLHAADKVVADNCPDGENKKKLLEALNKNALKPYILDFLATIATKFRERGIVEPTGMPSATVVDIDGKIRELRARPAFMERMHPDHKFVVAEISRLYEEKLKVTSQTA